MKLRPYQPSDFEAIIQLWWDSWHSSSGYAHHRPIADWKERWRDLEKTHEIVVMSGSDVDLIAAFAALNQQTCALSQLFVSPGWKRQGIGTQILQWAAQSCPAGFSLKTAADNREAIAFYRNAGLIVTGHSINDFNGKQEVRFLSTSTLAV
ncbi:MAG: GNAT family N-acetyltransferase [Phormidesmis sp.]